jgi:transcriptional regulator with XRE-family HTH domain
MDLTLARTGFPDLLRHWRGVRRISQLELALRAEVSARHVSFLESGRARPSRTMVMLLADALDMPLAERNGLLGAAGFTPAYQARPPGDRALALPEAALAWMLDRHAPYPGLALDRHWCLVRANAPARRLLEPAGIGIGDSLLAACGPNGALRPLILNWTEVARYLPRACRPRSSISAGSRCSPGTATPSLPGSSARCPIRSRRSCRSSTSSATRGCPSSRQSRISAGRAMSRWTISGSS